jgi:2-dehydro-3-deoxyphosphooctonate aldolase (KDO 8-P synthase)
MKVKHVQLTPEITIGSGHPPVIIAGPCVMESLQVLRETLGFLLETSRSMGFPFIFKSSFDKANRTSEKAYRGPGLEQGIAWIGELRQEFGHFPLLLDVHETSQIKKAAAIADVLQIPAFLSRQTDFIHAVANSGRAVNIKKGQFLSPEDVPHMVEKATSTGNQNICVTERGSSFGYSNLVVDMRSFPWIRETGIPVIFDATHAVQLPGGGKGNSGGLRQFVPHLARAAAGAGVDGFFFEVHPDPDRALCDGPNMIPPETFTKVVSQILAISQIVHGEK